MFYPGSLDQRKKQLLAKLAGQGRRGSGAAGGFKVGRPAGAGYGRGIGFGSGAGSAGQRGLALPQMLAGYGGGPGNAEYGQGGVDTSTLDRGFNMGGDIQDMGQHPVDVGQFQQNYPQHPVFTGVNPFAGPTTAQINPNILKQLLGNYGQQAPPQYPGNGRFGVY